MNAAKFVMYHPNGKGTGSALQLELHPAVHDKEGYVAMTIAPQDTIGSRSGGNIVYPTFNWNADRVFKVNLTFDMICRMLQVMRGECESIADDRGIYIKTASTAMVLRFEHSVEPVAHYSILVNEETNKGDATSWCRNISFVMNSAEALGLSCALEQSLGVLCFGVPAVCEHQTKGE